MTDPASNTTQSGRCLCGAVTYTGHGAIAAVRACHCPDCARWNGGPLMAVSFVGGITPAGPVRWYKSSDWAERGSCSVCGSALFWRMQEGSAINVSAGSLDGYAALPGIGAHIFVDRKPAFYDFADGAPRLTADETLAHFGAA